MKLFKKLMLVIAIGCMSSNVYSQLSLNSHLGYRLNFSGYSNNLNLGVLGEYIVKSEKNMVYLGFDYYFPSGQEGSVNAYNMLTSSSTALPAQFKTSYFSILFGAKRYLAGDAENDFGFYARAGIGLNYGSTKADPDSYDDNIYNINESELEKIKLSSLSINLGLGFEKEFDFGYVFGEGNLNLNTNSVNDLEVAWNLPAAFIIQAGVRFPISF